MKTKVILLIIMSVAQQVVAMQDPKISVLFAGGERHNYSRSTLRQFKKVATLLDDIADADECSSVLLEKIKKPHFDFLLSMVDAVEITEKRKLIRQELARAKNDHQPRVKLFEAVKLLEPDDNNTMYRIALAYVHHIHTLSESAADGDLSPRVEFLQYFHDSQKDNMRVLMSLFVDAVADETGDDDSEEVYYGVRQVMLRDDMMAYVSNRDAQELIKAIKRRARQRYPHSVTYIGSIKNYVFGSSSARERYPLVPHAYVVKTKIDEKTEKVTTWPGKGDFPLSIQELLDAQLFPQFTQYAPSSPLSLYCDHQGLTSLIGIQNVPGIQALLNCHVEGNAIQELPVEIFKGLSLQFLHVSFNEIQALPVGVFAGLVNLQTLRLHYNQLQELPVGVFAGLTKLQMLDVSGNKLRELPVGIFADLTQLQKLYLRENQLQELPAEVFAGLAQLQKLDLSGNQITQTEAQIRADNSQLPGTCKIDL